MRKTNTFLGDCHIYFVTGGVIFEPRNIEKYNAMFKDVSFDGSLAVVGKKLGIFKDSKSMFRWSRNKKASTISRPRVPNTK